MKKRQDKAVFALLAALGIALLTDCSRAFFANGRLADCEHVVIP